MSEEKLKKNKAKRRIYKHIIKENKTHQEAFDLLKNKTKMGNQVLAETIAKVPNRRMTSKVQTLIYTYVAVLGLIIVTRVLGIIFLFSNTFNPGILLTIVALGIIVPVLGIYSALTHRIEGYRSISIILAIGIMRSFQNEGVDPTDLYFIAGITINLAAIILGIVIPLKFNVPFKKEVIKEEVDGKTKVRIEYNFEDVQRPKSEELLDT